jgi:hypothetical protein
MSKNILSSKNNIKHFLCRFFFVEKAWREDCLQEFGVPEILMQQCKLFPEVFKGTITKYCQRNNNVSLKKRPQK